MMEEKSTYGQMPAVYKKDKATMIFLLDGVMDVLIGILYLFLFRPILIILTEPIQGSGFVNFNIIMFFDIVIFIEFIMAILEVIAVYFIKYTDNKQIPKLIKRLFIISHIILIPLAGVINYIVDLILM